MATRTRKRKYEVVHWSLARSSLAVRCAGVSAFRFPIVGVLSLVAPHGGVAAWARAIYQYHVNGMDTVDRSVG